MKILRLFLGLVLVFFLTGVGNSSVETVMTIPFGFTWNLIPPYVLDHDGRICGFFSGAFSCLSSDGKLSSWSPVYEKASYAGRNAFGFYLDEEEKFVYLFHENHFLSGVKVDLSGSVEPLGRIDLSGINSSLADGFFNVFKDAEANIYLCLLAPAKGETLCYQVSFSGGLRVSSSPKALDDLTKPLEGALGSSFLNHPFYALVPQGADYVVWQYDLSTGRKVIFNASGWPYLCESGSPTGTQMEGCLPLQELTYNNSYVDSQSGPLRVAIAGDQVFLAFRFKEYWRETYGEENLFFISGSINEFFGTEGAFEISGHTVTNFAHNPDYLFATPHKVWVYHYGIWHEIIASQALPSLATLPPHFSKVIFTGGQLFYPVREPLDESYQAYKLYLVNISPETLKICLLSVPGEISSSFSPEVFPVAGGFLLAFRGEEGLYLLLYDSEGNLRAQTQPSSLGRFVGHDNDDHFFIFSDDTSTYLFDRNLNLQFTLPYSVISAVVRQGYLLGAEGGILKIIRLGDGQLVKSFVVPTFTDLSEEGDFILLAGNEGSYITGAREPAIFSMATLSQLLQAEVWPAPKLRYYGGGNVYPIGSNGYFYVFGKKSLLIRPDANGNPIVKGWGTLPFEPINADSHPVVFENGQPVFYLLESDTEEDVFFQLKRYSVDFRPAPLEQAQEFHFDWREKIGAYPAPLDYPFGIEGIMLDETGIHPWSSDGQIGLQLALPLYDTPYDVYIAYLDRFGLHFFTPSGVENEPLPLWTGLEDGLFIDFGRFPFSVLPPGDYYLMIRKAGTQPFDFENPGYIVWQLWHIP